MFSVPPETGVMTDAKKTSGSALITPSAAPVVLLKVLRRPLTKTTNCVGPTAPIVSGGNAPVSASVAPRKVVLVGCGAKAAPVKPTAFPTADSLLFGKFAQGFESG